VRTYPVVHADVFPEREAESADARGRLDEGLGGGDAQALAEDDHRREAVNSYEWPAQVDTAAL